MQGLRILDHQLKHYTINLICNALICAIQDVARLSGRKGGGMGLQHHLILMVLHRILIFHHRNILCSVNQFYNLPPPLVADFKVSNVQTLACAL